MKATPLKAAAMFLAVLALASCRAFTSPPDPVTGIRQDAPPQWIRFPDPLDGLEAPEVTPPSEGHFGHEWMWR